MTEQALLQIIVCICTQMSTQESKILCLETYTNCAIVKNGAILARGDFDKKCNYFKDQYKCYSK